MSGAIRHLRTAATIVAFGVAGCGSSHTQAPTGQQQVQQVLRSYLHAQTSGDGQAACALLTPTAQRQLGTVVLRASNGLITSPPSCQDAVSLVRAVAGASLLDALSKAQITQVQVRGDKATAEITDGGAFAPQQVSLERSGSSWKIAGVPGLGG